MLFFLVACDKKSAYIDCPNCEADIPHGSLFCNICGVALDSEETKTFLTDDVSSNTDTTNNLSEPGEPTETQQPNQNNPSSTENKHEGYTLCAKCNKVWFKGDYLYCGDCKCSLSSCSNTKSGNSDRYCFEHMCLNTGCSMQRENDSLYCYNHNCYADSCKEVRAKDSGYCFQHKCGECNKPKEDGSYFCSLHNCNWSSCKAARYKNSAYCLEHKCADTNCSNPKQDNSSYTVNYCSNHDCKTCMRDRVAGSFYCVEHKCSVGGCANAGNYGIGGANYCNNHKPK